MWPVRLTSILGHLLESAFAAALPTVSMTPEIGSAMGIIARTPLSVVRAPSPLAFGNAVSPLESR